MSVTVTTNSHMALTIRVKNNQKEILPRTALPLGTQRYSTSSLYVSYLSSILN